MAALVLSATLVAVGSTTAQAAPQADDRAAQSVIAVSELNALGYSDQEIEAAIEDSPYVSIGYARTTPKPGQVSTQGVTFGKVIYVRVSQAQAKAIAAGSAALAVGILGLATGGVGGVIAAGFYGYVASLNDSALSKCARWEFQMSYPLPVPGGTSKVVGSKCI
ncbi:hypothetical protein [Cellulomonas sp. Y8]|uniref:hypothetical protein n=1 Tax=Cellulomonas sp. Y8 TaxID=2591145 RepID=UPI003D765D1B